MGNEIAIDHKDSGFSLIEVLVTLVIISSVLVPLFQIQQVLDRSSVKLRASTELISTSGTMLSSLSSINPMVTPKGSQKLAGLTLEWECKVIETYIRPGTVVDPPQKTGIYDLKYIITDASGRILEEKTIKQIGWEEIKPRS